MTKQLTENRYLEREQKTQRPEVMVLTEPIRETSIIIMNPVKEETDLFTLIETEKRM